MIKRAEEFARSCHHGQLRKYTKEPYIVHPEAVAKIVSGVPGSTKEMIAAAWLHDVVEDCGVSNKQILELFGSTVSILVDMLTDISRPSDGNRAIRKAIDCAHLAKASPDAQTIKLADLIHNTESIMEFDPKFAKVYLKEKQDLLSVLIHGDNKLWIMAKNQILTYW